MAPPIRIRTSFPLSQSLPSGSFHKPLILLHQRADRLKTTITENYSRPEYWSGLPFPSPGGSSQPGNQTQVFCIASRRFNLWATREAHIKYEWHVNWRDEIKEHLSLGEKLGNIVVVSLEGKLIKWQLNTILSVKQLPLLQLSQLEEC